MFQWKIEFGEVLHWNDESLENEVQLLTIDYNSDREFPCNITALNNENLQVYRYKELTVEFIEKELNQIEICDEMYTLNDFQLIQLKQHAFYWRDKEKDKTVLPFIKKEIERNIGLVFYYDKGIHNYTLAELLIDFNENEASKGIMTINKFHKETMLLNTQELHYFTKFNFEFKGITENGLQRYMICDLNFALTQAQSQKLCGLYIHKEDYQ